MAGEKQREPEPETVPKDPNADELRDTVPTMSDIPHDFGDGAPDVGREPFVDGPDVGAPPAGPPEPAPAQERTLGEVVITCESPFQGARCAVLGILESGAAQVRVLDGPFAGEVTNVYESQCKTP